MSLRTVYASESWERIYSAFSEISFVSYGFDEIKQSLIEYTKTYWPETFNDWIESSEFVALLEMFAYVAEQLAYRIDVLAHENFVTTAQRKQSILRLAKLVSYKATRNIPVRGLVKFNTVSSTERILDSRGTDLAGLTITWNDPNNANWREQFILVMNRVLNTRFGQPSKTFQIGDVVMDLYSLRNTPSSLRNGVFAFTAKAGLDLYPMEIVPADLDANGPFEREPDLTSPLSVIYANDGIGDGSDYTGFLGYVKQGTLTRIEYNIASRLPDRQISFDPTNVNHTDVWVQRIEGGAISERWTEVQTISEQNLVFNDLRTTRKKYEVDTGENDTITIVFGDGDFSDIPQGLFRFWMRQSANRSIVVQKNKVVQQPFALPYTSALGNSETCSLTFSLTTTLQNGAGTETIEHIRQAMPSTYYAQNRMVNGQDCNTFLLKDPSILRLSTVNRTFAGQPKHIDWNDASGTYENVKLFGDDASLQYRLSISSQTTSIAGQALIDSVIEPLLSTSGMINALIHASGTTPGMAGVVSPPRRRFVEDNRGGLYYNASGAQIGDGSLKEKTAIQGLIDRHWYGEPLAYVQATDGTVLAQILDPDTNPQDDSRIYAATVPRTVDGVNRFPPGDIGSGLQPIAEQDYFGLRYNRYLQGLGNGTIAPDLAFLGALPAEVWTVEVAADAASLHVRSNLRGSFPTGTVGNAYQVLLPGATTTVNFFTVTQGTVPLEPGDAFVLDSGSGGAVTIRMFSGRQVVNLNGWWEIISAADLGSEYANGPTGAAPYFHDQAFTSAIRKDSWTIFVRKVRQSPTNNVIGYEVHNRELKLSVRSPNTKFWFNSVDQLIDNDTKDRVYDNIKVLGSNFNSNGVQLVKNQTYDVVGAVKDANGIVDLNSLEIVPSDLLQEDDSGDLVPDRLLQFETFSAGSYEYFWLDPALPFTQAVQVTSDPNVVTINGVTYTFAPDAFVAVGGVTPLGRRQRMPTLADSDGLDFMWQHFSPFTNIIDPSVTNIHDAYLMTRGYYDSVIDYVRGTSAVAPSAPTPLELQNSYGYLLNNKMMSDTFVLHPGRIRLLFGALAEPQLRARFKVVRSQTGTLTNERIKEEVLAVISTAFDIDNWDFGEVFYATKLITLIHQRLPADVASVVLVPVYSTNSFGSLFTVESGFDEILQSAATLSDIDVVEALTSTVLRQS